MKFSSSKRLLGWASNRFNKRFSENSKFSFVHRKKIENIGKMTQMTQEEIVTNTKTVLQGLEALRLEHMSIIAGLTEGKKDPDKADIIQKNIENIELGLGEAQVSFTSREAI